MNQNYNNQGNNYYPNQVPNDQMPNNQFPNNQSLYQPTPSKKSNTPLIIIIIILIALISVVVAVVVLSKPDDTDNKKDSETTETEQKKLKIYGDWKTQSYDAETYWVFKDNEFWWYQSYNNLNDNYWYGKTTIETGRQGIKNVGLNENAIETILENSQGRVTEDDIYTLTLTPEKIISNGIDKSSTNIPENSKWHYVWIIVDYGEDGVEAQVLNVDTLDTTYYTRSN